MIRRIDLRGSDADPREIVPRGAMDVADAGEHIRPIIGDVRWLARLLNLPYFPLTWQFPLLGPLGLLPLPP